MAYRDAHALQRRLFAASDEQYLLLCEHPHVFTLGRRGDPENLLCDPAAVGAELVEADRGGDITYHGPGQVVGYPILNVAGKRGGGMADTVAYVHGVEQMLIDVLATLGLEGTGRLEGRPGVWVDPDGPAPRKVAAIGVRLSRGRTMHGFALNVDPDLAWFERIVPCGIADRGVTSLHAEGVEVDRATVVDALVSAAGRRWGPDVDRQSVATRSDGVDVAPFTREHQRADDKETSVRLRHRLDQAGVGLGLDNRERKPSWLRAPMRLTDEYRTVRKRMRALTLTTVCEEAGCPNISECWTDGTATFMLNGERCTRACGFCLVDTRQPEPVDPTEPERVARAVAEMGLRFAVLTAVARDDLADGGAAGFVATIAAIRAACPDTGVEVLIPDCKGDPDALDALFAARPEVLNHNIETVPRLQRAVRPSAGYARSLSVLARAADAGLTVKSGLVLGMGETHDEVVATLADLAAVGVGIVTIGQYLRPTARHLPVARWWSPDEFDALAAEGRALGLDHVEASPLTRSSYHAREAADAHSTVGAGG